METTNSSIKIKCIDDANVPIEHLIALSNEGYTSLIKDKIYHMTHLHVRVNGSLVAFLEEYDPHKFVWKADRFRTLDNRELHTLIKGSFVDEIYKAKNN